MSAPRTIATLTMHAGTAPLTNEDRERLIHDLEHLAEMLSIYACELRKGWHEYTARSSFYERVDGLGPAILFKEQPVEGLCAG